MLLLPTVGFDFIIWLATILSIATAIACFWFPVKNIPLTEEHKAQLQKWSVKSFVEPKVFHFWDCLFDRVGLFQRSRLLIDLRQ